ncbi:hypothetical protein IE981_15040 [Klebsiella pneumoniae]|uniref:hypothetical protein n=1 Tax=Enterobacteriaceae TaxID=543 RepID=UPI000665FEEE|nr:MULTISPECIES: hypothetical protein [Enterobacteriaceae]MBD3695576.1 hypothetical protein [Klebsiella pneumoniae]MBD3697638.1 hypothetical protein [Klebsiella pneumoniae]MCZ9381395.1 hypothetical protein [Klebsiella pneumoniae]OVH09321.1 hypothetical protein B8Z90_05675 [Klebsiella pneumoniae]OVH13144.1 hypothetical protein B8000_21100 [Klebsiella pneumoniae]
MKIEIAWWDLANHDSQVEKLNSALTETVIEDWRQVPGLAFKAWIWDPVGYRWGAVMLWTDEKHVETMPENIAKTMIGRNPDVRISFDTVAFTDAQIETNSP